MVAPTADASATLRGVGGVVGDVGSMGEAFRSQTGVIDSTNKPYPVCVRLKPPQPEREGTTCLLTSVGDGDSDGVSDGVSVGVSVGVGVGVGGGAVAAAMAFSKAAMVAA